MGCGKIEKKIVAGKKNKNLRCFGKKIKKEKGENSQNSWNIAKIITYMAKSDFFVSVT